MHCKNVNGKGITGIFTDFFKYTKLHFALRIQIKIHMDKSPA